MVFKKVYKSKCVLFKETKMAKKKAAAKKKAPSKARTSKKAKIKDTAIEVKPETSSKNLVEAWC